MPVFHLPRYSRINQYINSRISRLQIEEGTIRQIAKEFDLVLRGKPVNLPFGRRGSNVSIVTSNGKKVIRRYRQKWKISTINYEHSILSKLADLDFPAPRLNRTSDSRSLITVNGDHYALFDFAGGKNYSSTYLIRSQRLMLLENAAKTLADLHRSMDRFVPEGQHHLGFHGLSGDYIRDLEWQQQKLCELSEKSQELLASDDGPILEWLISKHENVMELLIHLDRELHGCNLHRVVIHGDYGLHNILFHESGKITPLDFELARIEWRLTDFLISFLRFRKRNGGFDFGLIERFIRSYHLRNPIDPHEWSLFPKVWQYNLLQFSIQYWNSYFEGAKNPVRLELARDTILQSGWGLEQSNRLVNLIQ
jgi:Ser/Thr protein kinase RdoA (MazF antagonist)